MAVYEPGVCNIGPRGRMRRAAFGGLAIAFAIGGWWSLRVADAPMVWRLIVFPILFGGFVGIFEATLRFCVVLSARGVYDLR